MAHRLVDKATVCGFGLIGGSMALDLQKGKGSLDLVAYDRPSVLKRLAKNRRFSVHVESHFKKATVGADIIILAAPHLACERMLERLADMKSLQDCLIIDTTAVKVPIARLGRKLRFAAGTQFLPTHPMAGREKASFENAAERLFLDHAWYLDEDVELSELNSAKLNWLTKRLQATPVFISSKLHDELVSEISHLPQLISTILGAQVNPDLIQLAGPGLRSMLRLAGSPYSVWSEIIDQNRPDIIKALSAYRDNLAGVIDHIKKKKSLDGVFNEASRSYRCL